VRGESGEDFRVTDTNLNEALETPVKKGCPACGHYSKGWPSGSCSCINEYHDEAPSLRASLSQIEARLGELEKELDEQDAAFSKQGGRNSDLVARLAQAEAALRLIADNGATAVVGEIEDMDVWCAQTIGRLKGIARSYFTEEGP
jgi:hypothetical protein